jgi:hypothetical protein
MELILKNIGKGLIKKSEFKVELQRLLPRHCYLYSNRLSIAFSALRLIKDIQVKRSKKSINDASKLVLESFFPSLLGHKDDFADLFVINILEIGGDLPIAYKHQLELFVKRDLRDIDGLLKHYSTDEFIELFRTKNETPRNHKQKTILEFYNRTLKKRSEIIDYLLFKLDDRAIEKAMDSGRTMQKSKSTSKPIDKLQKEYVISKDFPYRDIVMNFTKGEYKYIINFERLDYRKINLVINKSWFFPIKCNHSKGYSKQFYKLINKIDSFPILKNLQSQIREMPLLRNRRQVFSELQKLYSQKNWYGFYALALPQIEGIFSEMVRASKPAGKITGALTDKVQQIRPFYENSEYSFDYYEFHLPLDRNVFSHTGKVDDVRRKCKILLLDLFAIVKIFGELDSPVIRAKNLLDLGVQAISDIGKLSNILHLVVQTQRDGFYGDIKKSAEKFVYHDLVNKIDFRAFLANLEFDFIKGFKKYRDQLHLFSGAFDENQVDINSLNGPNFQNDLKRIQEVHDKYPFMFEEVLKLLLDTHYVLKNLTRLFPRLGDEIRNELNAFSNRSKKEMNIIKILNEKLKVKIPDDFLLMRDKLTHYLGEPW